MPKKPSKKKKEPKKVVTSFGPRLKAPKPVLATVLLIFAILQAVAVIDYRHDQKGLFDEISRRTFGFGEPNLVGQIGADTGFLFLLYLGLAAWLITPVLLQFSYLLYQRAPKQVSLLRFTAFILLITSVSGFMQYGETHFWPEMNKSFPEDYMPKGAGGNYGFLLYDGLLKEPIGTVGNGLILGILSLLSFYITFSNPLNFIGRQISKIPLPKIERKPKEPKAPVERKQEAIPKPEKEPDLPFLVKLKRSIFKPLIGDPVVQAETTPLDSGMQYQEHNRPNPKMVSTLHEAQPVEETASNSVISFEEIEDPKKARRRKKSDPIPTPVPIPQPEPEEPTPKPKPSLKSRLAKKEPKAEEPEKTEKVKIVGSAKTEKSKLSTPQKKGKYHFPKIDLIEASEDENLAESFDHQAIAERLRSTLEDFKIKVELGEVHIGPVITRYDLHPAPGVRVEKIAALEKNLTMALQAQSVRILAPVPGKGGVGVEIPNEHPQSVRVRDILETKVWSQSKAEIPIVLGKDVSGKPLVTDLTRMPHLLIAGSTGSGKTVCINAIICSLLYHSSPDDLRFMMVDPKIVEMKVFNDLPHMLIPVVTDPKRVPNALKWLISEMERRYQIFATVGVRNIAGFNAKILKNQEAKELAQSMDAELTAEERAQVNKIEIPRDEDALEIPDKKLPYIVCIIDELADLMMVAPADIETCVARLAQLARAAGIHLVIATQRPSVNVITGVIKANLPSRISFKVASKIDSRTILDGGGADTLIGRGDMLFIPPGIHHLIRAQGAFVSDEEIADIVEYLKINGPPKFKEEVQRQIEQDPDNDGGSTTSADTEDWGDALVPDAIEVLRNTKRASTSMLQRRLRIGYNRAARIMEILEEREIVGPDNGSQPREILVDLDDF